MAKSPAYVTEFVVPATVHDSDFLNVEDGGQAVICGEPGTSDAEFYVVLHSWSQHPPANRNFRNAHTLMRSLMGRRVRVTVEVID
jgi:hypothetical protein